MAGGKARLRAVPLVLLLILALGHYADARTTLRAKPKRLAKPDYTVYHRL